MKLFSYTLQLNSYFINKIWHIIVNFDFCAYKPNLILFYFKIFLFQISINLEFNTPLAVNDESMFNLTYCKNLEDLNVNYCDALTDIFLMNLDGLTKIKSFCICGYNFYLSIK